MFRLVMTAAIAAAAIQIAASYAEAYERYRKLYPRLKRHFAEQAEGL